MYDLVNNLSEDNRDNNENQTLTNVGILFGMKAIPALHTIVCSFEKLVFTSFMKLAVFDIELKSSSITVTLRLFMSSKYICPSSLCTSYSFRT